MDIFRSTIILNQVFQTKIEVTALDDRKKYTSFSSYLSQIDHRNSLFIKFK